jgi:hypothetical protein
MFLERDDLMVLFRNEGESYNELEPSGVKIANVKVPEWTSPTDRETIMIWVAKQKKYEWFSPNKLKECFVNVAVGNKAERKPKGCPGNHWRVVTSKIFDCDCGGSQCNQWTCTASKSTLPKNNFDIRKYKCLSMQSGACVSWSGEIEAVPAAGVIECRSCTIFGCRKGVKDLTSVCTRYSVPRIVEYDTPGDGETGSWGARFGFYWLHMIWILPTAFLLAAAIMVGLESFPINNKIRDSEAGNKPIGVGCAIWFLVLFAAFFAWMIGFVRWKRDITNPMPRREQQYPILPYLGITIEFTIAAFFAWGWTLANSGDEEEFHRVVAVFWFCLIVMMFGLAHVCGGIIAMTCILPICCGCGKIILGLREVHQGRKDSAVAPEAEQLGA